MATIEITADNFKTITDNDIVFVDFWARSGADLCKPVRARF